MGIPPNSEKTDALNARRPHSSQVHDDGDGDGLARCPAGKKKRPVEEIRNRD